MQEEKRTFYPRPNDKTIVELRSVITDPAIEAGEYSFYNDFVNDPRDFQKNNVLYHYPINKEKLIIGKFCSIACGAKFLFTTSNHTAKSLATYPFPIFFEQWGLPVERITEAWDNKGDIVIGNDVWIGYEAMIMQGITIGDGAIIGTRALVTKDVPPYTIVGGIPAKPIRKRFSEEVIEALLQLRWWDWDSDLIRKNIDALQSGDIEKLKLTVNGIHEDSRIPQ
ncbi:MAG: CatB-related O-acetyltransferase [Planctomycetia bacterium]|nr:CatB-related O-acetyltransferase [Planctomycetia bacterium]